MATVLAIGSLVFMVGLPVLGILCMISCNGCKQRHAAMREAALKKIKAPKVPRWIVILGRRHGTSIR